MTPTSVSGIRSIPTNTGQRSKMGEVDRTRDGGSGTTPPSAQVGVGSVTSFKGQVPVGGPPPSSMRWRSWCASGCKNSSHY